MRIACAALALAATAARAEPVPCPEDGRISVDADEPAVVEKVCATVARVRPRLNQCHMAQLRPLVIRVVPRLVHPIEGCMAQYDCRDQSISISTPETLAEMLTPDSLWKRLPTEALFDSLVVHELAHALLDRIQCAPVPCRADHEYIAFALQIGSLTQDDRNAVMTDHKVQVPVDPKGLNDFIALASPGHFAQKAWLHFSEPANGCAFVADIIAGRTTLRRSHE